METNESKQAQLYKGDIYLAQPDKYSFEETRTELEQALKLDPNSYWGLVDMGRLVMREIKDLDQAESYFQSAVNINPNHPYTYYLLGEVYRARGDLAQAEASYRQALAQQADYPPALEGLKALGVEP